jgi:hypothetical protein
MSNTALALVLGCKWEEMDGLVQHLTLIIPVTQEAEFRKITAQD